MAQVCLGLTNQGRALKGMSQSFIPPSKTPRRLGPPPALTHLHGANHFVVFQKNIVHRDLKLGNMVLNKR